MTLRLITLSLMLNIIASSFAQWSTFTTSNSGIPDNLIFDLAVDANNKIWMATGFGAASFDGLNWMIYDVTNTPIDPNSNNDFTAVMVDANDHVWIAADGAYLYEFDQVGLWTQHGVGFFGDINKIAQDQEGDIWVAHQFGIQEYNGLSWTDHTTHLPSLNATTVEVDADNEVWIGTNQGLVRYDNISQWTIYDDTNSGLTGNIWVEDVEQGIGNELWVGTRGGIYLFDQASNWTLYNSSNSGLFDDQVNSIAVDVDSIVWIANDAGDMGVLQSGLWTQTNLPFTVSFARDIVIDNDGYKWLGCSNALLKLNAQGGGIIVTNTTEVETIQVINLFPNPNNGCFSVILPKGTFDLKLYDMQGRLIWQDENVDGKATIMKPSIASGMFKMIGREKSSGKTHYLNVTIH